MDVGLRKLDELGIATTRPDDYFAEMVKTDDHMRKVPTYSTLYNLCSNLIVLQKVRERLLSRQKGLERKEKARKLRELKKFGKQVRRVLLLLIPRYIAVTFSVGSAGGFKEKA